MKKKVSLSWSGGKDSAFALYKALQQEKLEVLNLHTSFNDQLKRVGMHGTPESLIELQAAVIGLPLYKIYIPAASSNEAYEAAMLTFYRQQKKAGIEAIVFGDIFLEDLRAYRDQLLKKAGLEGIYPLWQQDSRQLIQDFMAAGFKTTICAADAKYFGRRAAGQVIDQPFIDQLPPEVDPCGERGEFHTFVSEGPVFKEPVPFKIGEVLGKSYGMGKGTTQSIDFWFADIKPVEE
ncbi:Dph6-related ATP pyrophosphatase [Nafulsella turpanensis]|uniref:Dph6-related ATP pyrophosphatase n=1 Tax=Nafulsella turpanensis TaxID=1265690 RepID=UPI000349952A|nr:diphthine--ammonia ligase [Nafulsella turpanensis]